MDRIAVFPGSFDPITLGHESVILRSLDLFDRVYIAIGHNSDKHGFFSIEDRITWIKKTFHGYDKIEVATYSGLTVQFCKEVNAQFILRGIRTSADFEFERGIAQMNKKMNPDLDTVFLLSTPELTPINSTIIRDIYRNGGDISHFVPNAIVSLLEQKL
ncbi:MAG: pantetheine-phosphate adenylyltransferase [Salinivirgaceae bacterium]|nr:pantetheine-phosphate adenylyltransferase [Salinivirgaceae bacterium]MDD4746177.1 pantetheine-phosphate adenylyltransferase [Salinivirgaceae bacterium]MDY0281746.1 pantetheine-phosphate adenylyltransferase [Salinivirgaceae bacterium]